jgi:hypothetical protein
MVAIWFGLLVVSTDENYLQPIKKRAFPTPLILADKQVGKEQEQLSHLS